MNTSIRRSIIGCFAVALLLSGVSAVGTEGAATSVQFNEAAEIGVDAPCDLNERVSRARTPEWFRMRARVKAC